MPEPTPRVPDLSKLARGRWGEDLAATYYRRLGYDIHRYHPAVFPDAQLAALLARRRIELILDVGANAGQFGSRLREIGYRGRIVSFEPLAAARAQLLATTKGDPAWAVAERAAIGERDGEIDIHVSANSVSSSALAMLDAHVQSAPESQYVGTERVPLRRLDGIAAAYLRGDPVTLLKIDTQGYEDRVLDGAAGILSRIAGVQLELSLVPLYQDQKLLPEMMEVLRDLGFSPWAIWPGHVDPSSARTLQVDASFFR